MDKLNIIANVSRYNGKYVYVAVKGRLKVYGVSTVLIYEYPLKDKDMGTLVPEKNIYHVTIFEKIYLFLKEITKNETK
jgi:hypothetical protein